MSNAPQSKPFFDTKFKEFLQALETLKDEFEVQAFLLEMETWDQAEDLKRKIDSAITNLKKIQTKARANLEEDRVQWNLASMELKDFWESLSLSLKSLEKEIGKKALDGQERFVKMLQDKIKKVQGFLSR